MAHTRTELAQGWTFKQHDGDSAEWLPVKKVPTQVHMDLLDNKKIPDPFVDLNERAVQWVGEKAWTYRVSFPTPAASQESLTSDLVFEGLDTFATVFLNGVEILKADNMFLEYRVNVGAHLKPPASEDNLLEIVFDSALLRGRELVKKHSHEHDFLVRQTEVGRLPTRKAQYNWGWDWGPILMTAGPWKPVYLEQYTVRITDLWIRDQLSADLTQCSGDILVDVTGGVEPGDKLALTLSTDGGEAVFTHEAAAAKDVTTASFSLPNPQLWYPLGYGKQARYEVRAEISRGGKKLASQSKKVGFRRAELVQEPDAHGKCFYFRINNVDVFCGGNCWIPTDSFQSQISAERYRAWIALMAESNQVMIRIWGGGVYEHDALLDACDDLGVMIWHDFQFACASYPTYKPFMDSFELEARQQIRRLRSHPSMIIWAGNNEDYQVQERYKLDYDFSNKDAESWKKSTFPARYIYEHFLPNLVSEEDPRCIYHPSSPWGDGKPTADPTVGDIHQWNLWHGAMNKYQEVDSLSGRFVSEFGMEGYPHLETLHRMVSDPSQRYPGSMAMDAHNKAIGHERRMMSYVIDNFRLGRPGAPAIDPLAQYMHLTQVAQAETMRYAYKFWRRDWKDRKIGGVLVWQLNDCWPTVSWAVVDYYLIRKPAFYVIGRALRPLDVGLSRTFHDWTQTGDFVDEHSGLRTGQVDQTLRARPSTLDVWIASSRTETVEASVTVRLVSVRSGEDIRPATTHTATAAPNTTTTVLDAHACPASLQDLSPTTPFDISSYDPYVIHATLSVDGRPVASDTAWPEPIKFLDLTDRHVSFDVVSPTKIVVKAKRPVKGFVFDEMEDLKLSDNGFDVIPGEDITVLVEGRLKAGDLKYTYIDAPGTSLPVS